MTGGVRLAGWSAFLALSLRLLHGAAFGHLSVPLESLDELLAWADRTAPTVMALSVVRLAALAATWYLAGATVLAIVADVAGWRRAALVVAALSPAVVRRLASRSAGVGLAAGALLAVVPMPTRLAAAPAHASTGPAEDPSPANATMTRLPPTPSPTADDPTADTAAPASRPLGTTTPPTTPPTPPPAADDPTADTAAPSNASATMTRLGGAGAAAPATGVMSRLPATPAAPATPPVPAGPGADPAPRTGTGAGTDDRAHDPGAPRAAATDGPPTATMSRLAATPAAPVTPATAPTPGPAEPSGPEAELWPVAPGDSFWSIAGEVLADIAGHRADDDEISRYWRQLIAANRHRLLDPANPDLLVLGQQLALPPPA